MTTKPADSAQELRRRAEEQFSAHETATMAALSAEETQKLLHDLRVHQIELEIQNEELRLAQHELETARARYFDLYDLAPVGYLTFNRNGLIREANLTAATMLGVVRKVLIQNVMSQFIPPEEVEVYHRRRKQLAETGETQTWDMRMVRADDSLFWAHLQAIPASNGEYWVTLTDISDRKRAEEEKHTLEQQLQQTQKLESLGVLAGGIAHDFNNLLTVIICNCSLALKRPNMAGELIPEIEAAAERASELCRQMMAYAGKTPLSLKKVRLAAVVEDMLRMLKATIKQNVVLFPDVTDDFPAILADFSQIRQVIMNLVINAAEAIGESQGVVGVALKKVEIRAGQPEMDHLGVAIPYGLYVCLEVVDSGCGMDSETRQRIFEPFYSTKFTGRGLGMSAVLGIIRSHKGALQLFSQPGQGSTFKVYLPVFNDGVCDVVSCQRVVQPPWQGSGTILLVEDEEQLLHVVKAILKSMGFSVIEASNGKLALEVYQKYAAEITLVLTDIGMPVMDGYGLFRELKKLDPKLPIIISSGFGDAEVTAHIPGDQIAGLVSKPYNFDQLREVLKSVVEGRGDRG